MTIERYKNDAVTKLDGAINGVQLSIDVIDAAVFPTLTGGDQFRIRIDNEEDIIVSSVSGNTLTVTRGTGATSHSDQSDVVHNLTANGLIALLNERVTDIILVTSDVIDNNVSTGKHGFAPKAPNDATKYLDGTGAYSVPAGASGALVLLEQHTASSSATLDFTSFISSTYDEYVFEIINIIPATAGAVGWWRCGTGAGPSWDTSSIYSYIHYGWRAGAAGQGGAATQAQLLLPNAAISTNANWGINGSLRLFSPQSTAVYKRFRGQFHYLNNSSQEEAQESAGTYGSTTAITGVRFLFSTGNVASGIIRVYGVAK